MKSLLTLKTFTGFLTTASVVVGVKAVNDSNFNSNDFMDREVVSVKRLDDVSLRQVASADVRRPAVQRVSFNKDNQALVDGVWEVRRIQDQNNEVVFEANNRADFVPMNFELIGTSLIRIGNDEPMNFRVSYLDESGRTIAVFRQFGKGYEIIEAVRITNPNIVESKNVAIENTSLEENKAEVKTGVEIAEVQDLVLERALHPTKDPNVLRGEDVAVGNLTVDTNRITEMNITVGIGKNYRTSLSVSDSEIKGGGQFSALTEEGEVTGIITNNGKDGYTVRFATGSLQGAVINFVTEEKLYEMNEREEEARLAREEAQELTAEQIEVVEDQNEVSAARSAASVQVVDEEREYVEGDQNIYENSEEEQEELHDLIEPETQEEFSRITEEVGFDFTTPARKPASL